MAFLLKHYTFSAKIRNLTDFHQRILSNQQPPSGLDIVNTLRYFQQTLLGLLKDVQNAQVDAFISVKAEQHRSGLFPNLNYIGLYHAVNNIIDVYGQIQSGQIALGSAILNTIHCLYLFLERDLIEQLPYNVACLLSSFPAELHGDILRLLCNVLLPFTYQNAEESSYAISSASTVIMMTFQFCQDARFHTWVLETLMSFKISVYKDVLSVIAYGTSESRIPAANLLFHYWPLLNPGVLDRRTVQYKTHAWTPTRCQHKNCSSGENNTSIKKCFNPFACVEHADMAPPFYLCTDCSKSITEDSKKALHRFCQPMSTIVNVCQNRSCSSINRLAVCTCFSEECVRANGFVPLRLCNDCHTERHTGVKHICHTRLPSPWQCDRTVSGDMITAIVSLLKETSYMMEEADTEKRPKWLQQLEGCSNVQGMEMVDERRMLSRYGIWMLVGLCTPTKDTPLEPVGHLMAILFQWFGTTALLPSDNTGVALEQLKNDYVCEWLRSVIKTHYSVFIQCLTPKPPDYAKVGGHWDKMSRRLDQLKEGLSKVLALIPYDLISFETWDKIMPLWLDALSNEVPEKDLHELKVVICKIFETDMSSLPFPTDQMYHFLTSKLKSCDFFEQRQALVWIQLLTDYDIAMPLDTLLNFFSLLAKHLGPLPLPDKPTKRRRAQKDSIGDHEGLQVDDELRPNSPLGQGNFPAHRQTVFDSDDENNAPIFTVALDILQRQFELSDLPKLIGYNPRLAQQVLSTLNDFLRAPWFGQHICEDPSYDNFVDCLYCRDSTIFYEELMEMIKNLCPKDAVKIEMPPEEDYDWEEALRRETALAEESEQTAKKLEEETQLKAAEQLEPSESAQKSEDLTSRKISKLEEMPPVKMATLQEEEGLPMEFVAVLPTEELETAVAQAVTLTEPDIAMATCKVVTTTLIDDRHVTPLQVSSAPEVQFWHTSQGKFRFTLDELPADLNMIYSLMMSIESHPDPDVIYYILHCMKYICLHAEALINAHKEHKGFLTWAQENILISKFWRVIQAQYSQIPQTCVPLILHCLTLPNGADVFWKIINEAFMSSDWKVRFAAVEKVTCIARFIDPVPVRGNIVLQGALANAFSFLIAAVEDPNSVVAQRARMYIETIKATSLKCLCSCLEAQFDLVIIDRPLIIHRLMLLNAILSDKPILSWEFFLQRFDTLSVEAQIQLEKTGEIAYPQDILHSDPLSDLYQRKLVRARQALEQSENIRSIVKHMDQALNYQKTLSMSKDKTTEKSECYIEVPQRETAVRISSRMSTPAGSSTRLASCTGSRNEPASLALGKLREFTDRESNFCMMLNKALDLENTERHTMHMLITLFMEFLANPKNAVVNPDEKALAKKQSVVLRHLNILLGYSANEKSFAIPPFRLRASAICNAFLSSLPKVLDSNLSLGNQILPLATMLLQFVPSPQRYASDYQTPNYTLFYLEPHTRHCWLYSLLVILYKYHFNQPPINETILILIQIVVNTLNAQIHQCQQVEVDYRTPLFRSRVSSWQESSGKVNGDAAKSGKKKLRKVFNTVRLLVRVMRSWPRSRSTSDEEYPEEDEERSEDDSSISQFSADDDGTTAAASAADHPSTSAAGIAAPASAAERYHRRRAMNVQARRQPTFDERDELDGTVSETSANTVVNVETEPLLASSAAAVESGGDEDRPLSSSSSKLVLIDGGDNGASLGGVDTRILEQIEEFDRSFAYREQGYQNVQEFTVQEATIFETMSEAVKLQPSLVESGAIIMEAPEQFVQPQICMQHVDPALLARQSAAIETSEKSLDKEPPVSPTRVTVDLADRIIQPITVAKNVTKTPPKLPAALTMATSHHLSSTGRLLASKSYSFDDAGAQNSSSAGMPGRNIAKDAQLEIRDTSVVLPMKAKVLEVIGEESTAEFKNTKGGKIETKLFQVDTGLCPKIRVDYREKNGSQQEDMRERKEKAEVPPICVGSMRYADTTVILRCTQCNAPCELFDEDTIALAVVCLSTAVHREPAMTMPYLPRILVSVCRIANQIYHPWQAESSLFVPGNCRSVARQFVRVVLHQLAPNKLFTQLFQSDINDPLFFKTISNALAEFNELNPVAVVQILLKDISVNWPQSVHHVISNLADYIVNIAIDSYLTNWGSIVPLFDSFLRRYLLEVNDISVDAANFFIVINHILRVQNFHTFRTGLLLLDSMSKLLSKIIQTQTVKLVDLLNLCSSCNRAFLKERDKEGFARCCVNELVQAIKFKSSLPEDNYMTIVMLMLEDIGEVVDESIDKATYNTAVADVAKLYLQDFIEFIADLHVLHRMKNTVRGSGLREDTLGGELKANLARYVSYEISRANSRDPRTIIRYVPWLLSPPTVTLQGPTEFIDCVGHVRQLAWILLGALYYNGSISCVPIPLETSHYISDHIQFVLAGFAERSKESVLHMSALFHAFHLCQLWTVYCEEISSRNAGSELARNADGIIGEFWARITPAILQLLSHSKVLADMVNLHFLNTVEALTECESAIIAKLFPMWHPILAAYHHAVPGHLLVRLDTCENTLPKCEKRRLEPWLKRVCFKISQVELQSSAATQFYTV